MNIADREALIELVALDLDSDANADNMADAILDAGFLGPDEADGLRQAIIALQRTVEGLRDQLQNAQARLDAAATVRASAAGALPIAPLPGNPTAVRDPDGNVRLGDHRGPVIAVAGSTRDQITAALASNPHGPKADRWRAALDLLDREQDGRA